MYMFFIIIGLLCAGAIEAMDVSVILGSGNKIIKGYDVKGADTFIFDGGRCKESTAGYSRVQLNISQIKNDQEDVLTIHTDDNIFPYIIFNRRENAALIGLYAPDQIIRPSQDITISLALKKYVKIVTNGFVDTSFLSSIKGDTLHVGVTSESVMQLPLIEVHQMVLCAEGNSIITMQDTAEMIADVFSIDRHKSAKIALTIKTKLLQAKNDGKGELVLKGSADEQKLDLKEGSYLAFGLKSNIIRAMIGAASGTIELSAKELITGTVSIKNQRDITYYSYNNAIWMYPEEDILKKYSKLLTQYCADDILRCVAWEILEKC